MAQEIMGTSGSHQFPFPPKLWEDDTMVGPSFVKLWACDNQSVHLIDTFEEDAIHEGEI